MTDDSQSERLREIADRSEVVHQEREAAISGAFALIDQLVPVVKAAVTADGQMRVLNGQLGTFNPYRDARERIVERLHGRLGDLRPYIPFVTDSEGKE